MKNILLYSSLFFLFACGSPKADSQSEHADHAVSDTLKLSAEQMVQTGIATASVVREQISGSISCNGVIDVPPQYLADLSPPLPGYITEIRVKGGENVRKGQVLAVLEHPDYIELQRRYLEASSQLRYVQADFNRQQELFKADATATKSFEKARADFQLQQTAVAALGAQLKRLGITPDKLEAAGLQQTISLVAPFNGFVVSVDGAIGRYVGSDRPLVQLVNKEHLHLELQLFEQDLERVKIGQPLTFTVLNAGATTYTGDVFLIGPTIDLEKRSSNIHAHIDGHHDFLRPGMYVKAQIKTDAQEALTVSELAIVTIDTTHFVYLQLAEGQFLRKNIRTGITANSRTAVLEGLTENQQVVTQGVQYLEGKYQSAFATEDGGH